MIYTICEYTSKINLVLGRRGGGGVGGDKFESRKIHRHPANSYEFLIKNNSQSNILTVIEVAASTVSQCAPKLLC